MKRGALSRRDALTAKALDLIGANPEGMSNDEIALKVRSSLDAVDAALQGPLEARHLISCTVLRPVNGEFRSVTMYRSSVSPTSGSDWRKSVVAHMTQRAQSASPVDGVDIDKVHCTRDNVVEMEPAGATPERDAVRKVIVQATGTIPNDTARAMHEMASLAAQALEAEADESSTLSDESFVCALYSNGVISIESCGRHLELPLDHTRQLLHYLDHMQAQSLVGSIV